MRADVKTQLSEITLQPAEAIWAPSFSSLRKRVGLYSAADEILHLTLPLLLLAVSAAMALSGKFSLADSLAAQVVIGWLFFDWPHSALTWSNFFEVPAFSRWAKDRASEGKLPFFTAMAALAAVVILSCTLAYSGLGGNFFLFQRDTWVYVYLLLLFQHGIAQSFGISKLYSRKITADDTIGAEERNWIRRADFLERLCFHGLLVAVLYRVFLELGVLPEPFAYRPFAGASAAFFVVCIAGLSLSCPAFRRSNKFIFNLRTLVFAIPAYGITNMRTVMAANHGLEYFFFCKNMKAEDGSGGRRRFGKFSLAFCLGFVALVMLCPGESLPLFYKQTPAPRVFHAVEGLVIGIAIMHFLMDRALYRFRNRASREHLLPLFGTK